MKKVIYLGQAAGIKNLVANKEYQIDTEGDSVYLIKNESGNQIPYSKKFFREVVEPPPPPPLAPISSVIVDLSDGNHIGLNIRFRGERYGEVLHVNGTNISCGISQISEFRNLITAIAGLIDGSVLSSPDQGDIVDLILVQVFDIIRARPSAIKIFSLSEANIGHGETEARVYRLLLNFLERQEDVKCSGWIINPNSGNEIALFALYCDNPDEGEEEPDDEDYA